MDGKNLLQLKVGDKIYGFIMNSSSTKDGIYIPMAQEIIKGIITNISYSLDNEIMHHDDCPQDFKPNKLQLTDIEVTLNNGDKIISRRSYSHMKYTSSFPGTLNNNYYKFFLTHAEAKKDLYKYYNKSMNYIKSLIDKYTREYNQLETNLIQLKHKLNNQ